jgi:hypothetical protein
MQRSCDHMVPAGLADSALDRKAMSAVQRSLELQLSGCVVGGDPAPDALAPGI